MEELEINKRAGFSLAGLIQVELIVLKLCKVINWSWWLVLMPLWIELGIAVIVIALLLIAVAIAKRK